MQVARYIELAYRSRANYYFPELKRLREVCARAVDPGFAFIRIMSMPSTVCLALGLLYEAVSGQSDADLKRACNSVLQNVDLPSGTD